MSEITAGPDSLTQPHSSSISQTAVPVMILELNAISRLLPETVPSIDQFC